MTFPANASGAGLFNLGLALNDFSNEDEISVILRHLGTKMDLFIKTHGITSFVPKWEIITNERKQCFVLLQRPLQDASKQQVTTIRLIKKMIGTESILAMQKVTRRTIRSSTGELMSRSEAKRVLRDYVVETGANGPLSELLEYLELSPSGSLYEISMDGEQCTIARFDSINQRRAALSVFF